MATKGITTLYHPTFGDAVEVPTGDVARWVDQGWLKTKPKVDK